MSTLTVEQVATLPLPRLLEAASGSTVVELPQIDDPRWGGFIIANTDRPGFTLGMPAGRSSSERDREVRALLAHVLHLDESLFASPFQISDVEVTA